MMFLVINIGLREEQLIFEKHHKEYLDTGRPNISLPTTTLGNISSWIAHDLQSSGRDFTFYNLFYCFAHAVLGTAWLKSGMVDKFFGWEVKLL
jgi:hypothetical protein